MKIPTLIIIALALLSGCSPDRVRDFKEPEFTQGCYASKLGVRLGYFNQEGAGEACKVKCSKTLPKGYCWEFENQQAGCKAKVGECE